MGRFAVAILAVAALSGCRGGEGEDCKSDSVVGPTYCDDGLVCDIDSNTCQRAGSRREGEACSAGELCSGALWCDEFGTKKCRSFLREGDACSHPFSCGPDLACLKGPRTCRPMPDASVPAATATVIGTLTLPGGTRAKGMVEVFTTLPPGGTPVASSPVAGEGTNRVEFLITGVSAGTYFLRARFDVDGSGGASSTPGDYAGWYGHDGDGNPPAAANVVVPDTGTVRFDFNLVQR